MTRDPERILAELDSLRQVDATQREHIARTRATIAGKKAELQTLEHHVDVLLCSTERRRMAVDALLDELLAAKERDKETV